MEISESPYQISQLNPGLPVLIHSPRHGHAATILDPDTNGGPVRRVDGLPQKEGFDAMLRSSVRWGSAAVGCSRHNLMAWLRGFGQLLGFRGMQLWHGHKGGT